ncbi:MAG: hypothetical protein A4E42_01460 [Methanoregulaceae archaeon PtaU1.Bin222]|nr:MAG: hypothetical protein A4E42_01460 [Methanoregulaceae archaeon PtaU1.Bin222]
MNMNRESYRITERFLTGIFVSVLLIGAITAAFPPI